MAIRHIVFDIGRVLIQWDPERPYRALIPDEEQRRWFLSEVCSPAWIGEQDRGRSFAEGERILIDQYPDSEDWIRAFLPVWGDMVPGLIDGTPDIMRTLIADGWDVTMLTNFHQDTFLTALERFPVLAEPRGVTVSGRVRMIKPEPEIYAHHAQTFGLDPAATVFFDDSPRNIDAAHTAGWHAHLFTSADSMRRDLATHGITV